MNKKQEIIELTEYQPVFLDNDALTDEEALKLHERYHGKILVEPPSFKNNNQWELTSLGWVGYICFSRTRGLSLKPKVPLGNLFQMLEYAYNLESLHFLEELYKCKSVREFFERLAIILAEKLLARVRQGIYKAYQEKTEELSFVRGRINMNALLRRPVKSKYFGNSATFSILPFLHAGHSKISNPVSLSIIS